MARHSDPVDRKNEPPILAVSILSWATHPDDRVFLLGDMKEEYFDRAKQSTGSARDWYWKQTLLSLPYLVSKRFGPIRQLALIIGATVAAFILIYVWDILIARNFAQYLAAHVEVPSQLVIRIGYFTIQMMGVTIAGALLALIGFSKTGSVRANLFMYVGPIILTLIIASAMAVLNSDASFSWVYLFTRLALTILFVIFGAYLMAKKLSVNKKSRP